MRLTVIGCGYLGAVHAAAMADLGHHVLGVETDPARLALLARGEAPFYEPGLDELLRRSFCSFGKGVKDESLKSCPFFFV